MRIKTDLSHLNTLVRQLLTGSAVGFIALAVILTLMSAALQYRVVPVLMRQLDRGNLGGISQIYRPLPLAVAYQAPPETTVIDNQIVYAEPVIPPTPIALSLPDTSSNVNNSERLLDRAANNAAKALRTAQKETTKAARIAEDDHVESLEKADRNNNNEYSRGQDRQSDKEKRDSSRHKEHKS